MNTSVLKSFVALSLTCALMLGHGAAQSIDHVTGKAQRYTTEGKPLAALSLLEKAYAEAQDEQTRDMLMQQLATELSRVGETQAALELFALYNHPSSKSLKDFEPEPAIQALVQQAKEHQIVILNEAHHVPMHRAFALQLAQALRAEGFEYLAAETFMPDMQETEKRGYLTFNDGYYTTDPVFADFIRQSIRSGYRLVGYETTQPSTDPDFVVAINQREQDQTANLIEKIFSKNPKAKVLIYVGYAHAYEVPEKMEDGRELEWMATRLKKATGLDPLTIDQTQMMEVPDRQNQNLYQEAVDAGWLKSPVVLKSKTDRTFFNGEPQQVDVQVLHPPVTLQGGRPDWLSMGGYRKHVALPEAIQATSRVLVRALVQEEELSVAMDQVLLKPGEPRPDLMLPSGAYVLDVQDETGNTLMQLSLKVE